MNRLLSSLIGAGLVILLAGAARADVFTIERLVSTASITHSSADGDITVTFQNLGAESPKAESMVPGTSMTLLNYTVTSTAATLPTQNVTFNDDFTLSILLTDYSYPDLPTHTSVFNGHISGFANAMQDQLIIDLQPANADAMAFDIYNTSFRIGNLMKTLPPIVNDTSNPGAISAQIVSVVPEPGSMALLGTGLIPAIGLLRRRRR